MLVVTKAEMKRIEENSLNYDLTYHRLMENAGSAAAAFIRRTFSVSSLNCMVFCAKGNNGGDGFVVARKLAENDANVVVVLLDGALTTEEAASMYNTIQLMELPILDFNRDVDKVLGYLEQTDIIVDAICGTGFSGRLRDVHRAACQAINSAVAAVISLDLPTGVECDTGAVDADAVHADFTIAFDSLKPLHLLPASQPFCGLVEVADIGIPNQAKAGLGTSREAFLAATAPEDNIPASEELQLSFAPVHVEEDSLPGEPQLTFAPVEPEPQPEPAPAEPAAPSPVVQEPSPPAAVSLPSSQATTLDTRQVFAILQPRHGDSHKGDFGRLLIFAGSQCYRGAAALASLAALRCGAGIVTLASTAEVCATTASHILESTYLPLPASAVGGIDFEGSVPQVHDHLSAADAIVFGPGLGNTSHTAQLLCYLLEHAACPIVVDADGINVLAQNIHVLQQASATVILTPHSGEMARLCSVSPQDINRDRQAFALRFAKEHGVILVLKGAGTLVAAPNGELLRNHTGNPGLAKGGSGDVLAGMIGALLAQGYPAWDAATCAVHLHGLAADRTAVRRSQYAMLPSELLEDLSALFLENGR